MTGVTVGGLHVTRFKPQDDLTIPTLQRRNGNSEIGNDLLEDTGLEVAKARYEPKTA